MESFLPPIQPNAITAVNSTNNYLGGFPSGFDNHVIDWRVDYDLSAKHRISSVGTIGVENYLNNYAFSIPAAARTLAATWPTSIRRTTSWKMRIPFTPNVVNQLKFGFTRFFQNIHDATQGVKTVGHRHLRSHQSSRGARPEKNFPEQHSDPSRPLRHLQSKPGRAMATPCQRS